MSEREILFRGKLKDKDEWIGEWIEGIYCPCYWDLYMRRVEKPRIIILSNKKKTDGLWREVIPETVGQYTGLTDKNGKKIFEGDIVRAFTRFSEIYVFPVTYHDGTFWFNNWSWTKFLFKFENIEIIGNIHDNSEILKSSNL